MKSYLLKVIVLAILNSFIDTRNLNVIFYYHVNGYDIEIYLDSNKIREDTDKPNKLTFTASPGSTLEVIMRTYFAGAVGIHGLIYIGSSIFTTNIPIAEGWVQNGFINYFPDYVENPKKLNNINIFLLGKVDYSPGSQTTVTFEFPNKTYCYSKDNNDLEFKYDAYKDNSLLFPMKANISPVETGQIFIKITSSVTGQLTLLDNSPVNVNTYYFFDSLFYTPTAYGLETITYQANTDDNKNNESAECYFKLIVCYLSCAKCNENHANTDSNNHNCIACKSNYYKKYPDSLTNTNCYHSSEQFDYYYLDLKQSLFMPCHSLCLACNDNKAKSCTKCKIEYYFKDPTDYYCHHKSYSNNNPYYLDESSSEDVFKACFEKCSLCTAGYNSITITHNCKSCKTGNSFFKGGDDKQDSNCYDSNIDKDNYYYVASENTYYICYESCATCTASKDVTSHHCSSCKEPNYFYYEAQDPNSCYNTKPTTNYYYLPSGGNKYMKCHDNCIECKGNGGDDDNQCEKCKLGYSFYENSKPAKNCYDNITTNKISYYYVEIENKYYKCYNSCDYCTSKGDSSANLCTKCSQHHYFYEGKTNTNCYDPSLYMNEAYYLPTNSDTYKKCYSSCATCSQDGDSKDHHCDTCNSPLVPNPLKQTNCIADCLSLGKYWIINEDSEYICLNECENEYPYAIPDYKQCVSICPANFQYLHGTICKVGCPINTFKVNKTCLDDCYPDAQSQLQSVPFINHSLDDCINYITEFIMFYTEFRRHIAGIGFSFEVYTQFAPLQQLSNISNVDFSNCISKLREEFPLTSDIIIAKFDIIRDKYHTNQIEYIAYNSKGELLDLSRCQGTNISVYLPIDNTNNLHDTIMSYSGFFSDDIDLFNPNDTFYNDYCFLYPINGVDLPLSDRREEYFHSIFFCEESCYYDSINNTANIAKCICPTKSKVTTTNSIANQILIFPSQVPKTNIIMVKCYHLFITFTHTVTNPFFLTYGILVIANILMIPLYYFNGLLKLLSKVEGHARREHSIFFRIQNEYMTFCSKSQSKGLFNDCENWKNLSDQQSYGKIKIESKGLKNKIKSNEFGDLPYRFALILDERSMWRMFLNLFIEKSQLMHLMKADSPLELMSIKISSIILSISIISVLSALSLQDKLISYKVTNQRFQYERLTLVATVIYIINKLIKYKTWNIVCNKQMFSDLMLERHNVKTFASKFYAIRLKLISMSVVLFFFTCLISLFAWYYMTIFSLVYSKSVLPLMSTMVFSIGIDCIVYVVICLIITLLRFFSLTNQSQKAYYISVYLHSIV